MDKGFQRILGDSSDGDQKVSETTTFFSLDFKCLCHIGGGDKLRLDEQIAQSHSLFDDVLRGESVEKLHYLPVPCCRHLKWGDARIVSSSRRVSLNVFSQWNISGTGTVSTAGISGRYCLSGSG